MRQTVPRTAAGLPGLTRPNPARPTRPGTGRVDGPPSPSGPAMVPGTMTGRRVGAPRLFAKKTRSDQVGVRVDGGGNPRR